VTVVVQVGAEGLLQVAASGGVVVADGGQHGVDEDAQGVGVVRAQQQPVGAQIGVGADGGAGGGAAQGAADLAGAHEGFAEGGRAVGGAAQADDRAAVGEPVADGGGEPFGQRVLGAASGQ